MSADELRRAAKSERQQWGGELNARLWPTASVLHLALADWLDDEAVDRRYLTPTPPDHALIIARLINGAES